MTTPTEADRTDRAVAAAAAAFEAWRRTPAHERAGRLLTDPVASARVAADLLDEVAVTGVLDAGRALAGAPSALDASAGCRSGSSRSSRPGTTRSRPPPGCSVPR